MMNSAIQGLLGWILNLLFGELFRAEYRIDGECRVLHYDSKKNLRQSNPWV